MNSYFYNPNNNNYFNKVIELFLLFGDVYVKDGELGKKCHNKRVQFENLLRKHNKQDKLSAFYKALADLELGRDIIIYAKPKK